MWRVYYGDGATFDGKADSVPRTPAVNVQVIVEYDADHGWHLQLGSDYYVWQAHRWVGVDYPGLVDYLMYEGWKRVLFGRTIRNEAFQAIYQSAKGYRDRLNRSGVRP